MLQRLGALELRRDLAENADPRGRSEAHAAELVVAQDGEATAAAWSWEGWAGPIWASTVVDELGYPIGTQLR